LQNIAVLDDESIHGKKKSFEEYTGTTKPALLAQSEFALAEMLALIFLYTAAGVNNTVGKKFVQEINEEYIAGLSDRQGIKVIGHPGNTDNGTESAYADRVPAVIEKFAAPASKKSISKQKYKIIFGAIVAALVMSLSVFMINNFSGREISGEAVTENLPHNFSPGIAGAADVKTLEDIRREPVGEFNPANVMNSDINDKKKIYSTIEVKNALGSENIKEDAQNALRWLKTQCITFTGQHPDAEYLLQLFK
jgi:hypothetical protein